MFNPIMPINKFSNLPVVNFACVSILFFAIVFSFPLLVIVPSGTFTFYRICIFSTEAIAALSVTLLILKKDTLACLFDFHPVPAIALTLISAIGLIHFILIDNYSYRDFMYSITLFAVPLAIYAYAAEAKTIIVRLLSLFWLMNIIHFSIDHRGISGNWNWDASLILATTPFVIYFVYKGLSGRNTRLSLNLFISSVLCLISLYFLYACHSKGAWLSLIAVCFIVFIVYLPRLKRRFLIRFAIYSMLLLILLVLFEGQAIAGLLFNDVRSSLWLSTLRLCMDNPFLGVSCPSFESAYAQYRPIGYFLKSQYFAFRTTHPHNELLYILACFGIFGAVSWIVLWIYPLVKLFKVFKKLDTITRLSLLSLSILVVHSMFDLILFQWPTIFIACILLGLLWRECWPTRGAMPASQTRNPMPKTQTCETKTLGMSHEKMGYLQKFLISLSFVLSFTVFILFSYQDFRYSENLRNSEIAFYASEDPAKSIASLNAAIDYIPVPPSISHAGIVASAVFKDNIMSLFYFDKLLQAPCPQIAHSNRHIAGALLKSGRKKEALDFLRRDTRNFPISVVSLYMEMSLENELGQKEEAEITAEKLYTALRHMGLTEKHIPAILENPYYENKFVELKNMGK